MDPPTHATRGAHPVMRAMVLERPGGPLVPVDRPRPVPDAGQVLVRVSCCAVCRTDLHVVDGELPDIVLPLVPGHQVVGTVAGLGPSVDGLAEGDRVGVPWLGWTCGRCAYCASGRENLCPAARFTGYHLDGGFAEYLVADARYTLPLPPAPDDPHAAPLLCAGLIGFRAYRMAGDAPRLGLFGFGAAAHILAQIAVADGREVHAFTRPGDRAGQAFARRLGAVWAGGSDEAPPAPLDAAILFAPVGALVPAALQATAPGGTVVCAGIHMSDIPAMPYRLLWQERMLRSVANLTRNDGMAFLDRLRSASVETIVRSRPLAQANEALADVREGRVEGAVVLAID